MTRLSEFEGNFGRHLRLVRSSRRMSQTTLAAISGFGTQHISNLERGLKCPSLIAVFVLAEALEVHPKLLMFGEE